MQSYLLLLTAITAVVCETAECALGQAELFRLEGLFHRALNDPEAANRAFSTSLALWPQLAAGWLSWGDFCDSRVSSLLTLHLSTAKRSYSKGQHSQSPGNTSTT